MALLFDALDRRLQEQNFVATERHKENVDRATERHRENVEHLEKMDRRLVGIENEVRQTNGRVTRAEEQIRTLFDKLKGGELVTVGRLKWYLACAGGGVGATLWILKLMGKL